MSEEQERYYRNQNRDRRKHRIGKGFDLIGMTVACLIFLWFFHSPVFLFLGMIAFMGGLVFAFKD
jgi:hypothetical protein